jgi:hypothetical protein
MTTVDKVGAMAVLTPLAAGLIVLAARLCGVVHHLVGSVLGWPLM